MTSRRGSGPPRSTRPRPVATSVGPRTRQVSTGGFYKRRPVAGSLQADPGTLGTRPEDELLWPLLLDRVGLRADLVHRMEAQHERLAGLLTRIDDLTARWRARAAADVRDDLADVLATASGALDEHLADEERELLPLVSEFITPAEWNALNARGREAIPKNKLALVFVGAILEEASPRETTMFLAQLPAPARLLWRMLGPRTYARSRDSIRRG
ncbi:hemerythrin domain-containing protein [Actinoplanes sp. NPDC049599]|uniref:hemerythrin domain-containing protein n=1 Tax=Actinoplanes sp. NPDC049599 TaxID=3363903 RepID=UPI0037A49AC8